MAAELEKMREYAEKLAEQFRNAGQTGMADALDTNAQDFAAKAIKARQSGFYTFSSSESKTDSAEQPSQEVRSEISQQYIPRQPQNETSVLPSREQLIEAARGELKGFFGKDIAVPEPPDALFHTLEKFNQLGIRGFEPHYLPGHQFSANEMLPGWKIRPEPWFWKQIEGHKLERDAATLKEGWYAFDGRKKPIYRAGQQVYDDDYLAILMENLRVSGEIRPYDGFYPMPINSRFGASPNEIEGTILHEFAKQTQPKGTVKNMTYMQANTLVNIAHPEWSQTDTYLWFSDRFRGSSDRIRGGSSVSHGFSFVCGGLGNNHDSSIAFNPVISFPSKKA